MEYQSYQAWGLNIVSCMKMREFLPGNNEPPDVFVAYDDVPTVLEDARFKGVCYQAGPGRFLLNVEGIARYLVEDGRNIRIQRAEGAGDDAIRLFLQGSAFGALLHQRGVLPLHASGIRAGKGAVLFCGVSGVGKSTLAGTFFKRGYPVLADDICALKPAEKGPPLVVPGFPQIKLWADAIQKLEENFNNLHRVRQELDKYGLPVVQGFCVEHTPLARIYLLRTSNTDTMEIEAINGLDKLNVLLKNTYRFRFIEGLGKKSTHFQQCVAAGHHVEMRLVTRPRKGFRIDELADLIEEDIQQ